jgi:hypothetical protein
LPFDDQVDYDESELEVQVLLVMFTCIFLGSFLGMYVFSLALAYAHVTFVHQWICM